MNLSTDRELAVANFSGPGTATIGAPGGTRYGFDLINGNSVAESEITVTVTGSFSREGRSKPQSPADNSASLTIDLTP